MQKPKHRYQTCQEIIDDIVISPIKICKNPDCRKEIPQNSIYCPICGTIQDPPTPLPPLPLPPPERKKCPKCGKFCDKSDHFCVSCRYDFEKSDLVKPQEDTSSSDLNKQLEKHSNGFLCALSVFGVIVGIVGFFLGWPHVLNIALVLGCSRAAAYYA